MKGTNLLFVEARVQSIC